MDVQPCLLEPTDPNYADSSCHGYLADICECTFGDIFTETAYISTIFDWQNAVYLIFIIICIHSAKVLFKMSLEFTHASSHEGVSRGESLMFAVAGTDVTGTMPKEMGAGFGGELETQSSGAALQQTKSRAADADTHYTKPKSFSSPHITVDDLEGTPPDGISPASSGGAQADASGVTVTMPTDSITLWARQLGSPALLIALAAYLFAITTICVASISEFAIPSESYHHVGWDTQSTSDGVTARLGNIGGSIVWQIIGVVLMTISQSILRHVTFGDIDLVGEITAHTQRAKQEGYGMNVAAAILEGGGVVSAGMVAAANISGAPKSWGEDLASVGIYFCLSQLGFIIYTKIFDCFYISGTIGEAITKELPEERKIQMPHGQKPCGRGNVAVAISYSCMMVSFAMLISNAVFKSYELANFGVWFVVGGALQLIFRQLLDMLIAPGRDLDAELDQNYNWGFACVIGAVQLSVSRVLASLMEDSCAEFQYTEGPGGPTATETAACAAQVSYCEPCAAEVEVAPTCTGTANATATTLDSCTTSTLVVSPNTVATTDTTACTLSASADRGATIGTCASADPSVATCAYVAGSWPDCPMSFAAAADTTSASCAAGCLYSGGITACAVREGACAEIDGLCTAFVGANSLSLGDSLMQYEQMLNIFQFQNLLALGILLFFIFMSKFTYQIVYAIRLKAWEDGDQFQLIQQIAEKGNSAIAISFAGYLFGVGTLLSGLFKDLRQLGFDVDPVQEDTTAEELAGFTQFTTDIAWVGIGFGMLLVVQIVNDFVVFHQYNNALELYGKTDTDGTVTGVKNVALACVEAGHFIGASFIIAACIQGENMALGIVFFLIGEACLCVWSVLFEVTTKYDDRVAIQSQNVAAGLNWGLNIVAMGLLLSRAIYMSNSVLVFFVWFVLGSTVMLIGRKFIDHCVLPEIDLDKELSNNDVATEGEAALAQPPTSENWGVALLAGVMTISLVQCLNTFLRDCEFEFIVH